MVDSSSLSSNSHHENSNRISRHLVTTIVTAAAMFVAFVIITIPLAMVFVIDDAFVASEYAMMLAMCFALACGLSTFLYFPLGLLGQRLLKSSKKILWLYPLGIFVCAAVIFHLLSSFHYLVNIWSGLLVGGFFVFYWILFWTIGIAIKKFAPLKESFG